MAESPDWSRMDKWDSFYQERGKDFLDDKCLFLLAYVTGRNGHLFPGCRLQRTITLGCFTSQHFLSLEDICPEPLS